MATLSPDEILNLAIFRTWLFNRLAVVPVDKRLEYLQRFKTTLDERGFQEAVKDVQIWSEGL